MTIEREQNIRRLMGLVEKLDTLTDTITAELEIIQSDERAELNSLPEEDRESFQGRVIKQRIEMLESAVYELDRLDAEYIYHLLETAIQP